MRHTVRHDSRRVHREISHYALAIAARSPLGHRPTAQWSSSRCDARATSSPSLHRTRDLGSAAETETAMMNRPSYAQQTLERTRAALERLPVDLAPAVGGVVLQGRDRPTRGLRWRRKGNCTRPAQQ
jgi:hypothetical protein